MLLPASEVSSLSDSNSLCSSHVLPGSFSMACGAAQGLVLRGRPKPVPLLHHRMIS